MNNFPKRKPTRLKDYDYSTPGAYFVTICAHNRKRIFSQIVGTGLPDGPQNIFTHYGKIVDKYINQMNEFYENVSVDKYVIMPNHIHLLISVTDNGPSGTPVPTTNDAANSIVSKFIGTLKRFCNKEYGENVWQYRSYDHIIRNEKDYTKIWEYIDTNVIMWEKDCFYTDIKS